MNDLQKVTNTELIRIIRNLKGGMMKVINMGERAHVSNGKDCPPEASFAVSMMFLQSAEAEVKRRGFDPSDKRFGHDLMAEIAEIQVEIMSA